MVLIRKLLMIACVAGVALTAAPPASAHRDHDKQPEQEEDAAAPPPGMTPGAMHERMEEHIEAMEAARPKTFSQRLTSWIGRTHPFAVHFPIALFPVALVALFLARRRGEVVELIRSLIVVAGAASVVAALLGWFSGGFVLADADPVQLWHRWIGTGLALVGAATAVWAWRRRGSADSPLMVGLLAMITLALLVQGWLGAALVHGADHMAF